MVFIFLLTVYLLIKKKDRFLFIEPLSPSALRENINELGASFIKLAQVLATRADFFSDAYLAELRSLHDEIPPMSKKHFQKVYDRAFGDSDPFESFNEEPIASASIGEVHEAWLKSGEHVAVKLRRWQIADQVMADIRILTFFNQLFSPLFSHYTKNSIDSLIAEFSDMILKEVSFTNELSNLKTFSKVYEKSGVIFPIPYETYCSDDAIVMRFEEGIRFDDKEGLKEKKIDFSTAMNQLISFYTEQMLINGYFHADPHPGNLLIREDGTLVLLDFGMVKRISNPARIAIIEMVKSAHEQDFELYISSCKRLGVITYEAPQDQMTELAQKMFEIFNDDSLDATSMQELAFGVMASMRDFPFKLPQEAIYIMRASAIIEGLGTIYIPNFNGVKDILPLLQQNIPRALGADNGILEAMKDEVESLPLTLRQIKTGIQKISEDELRVHLSERQLEWLESRIGERIGRFKSAFVLILLAFFILLLDPGYKIAAIIFFALGAIRLLYR
ncbi:ABC1 kinase family protein [Sulfurovum riftiae]|uniref:ABC transporter n=1 Tax=Sulfurovum riftiae TaxID=1630136 RepID=A0A151CF81_9BACT|nr:AarF/UbiB family protein [Sulfurovum riftiae]KYJ86188.1 ABC transporter [Sulfurovum riftiae]